MNLQHWNNYYSENSKPFQESDFATFVLKQLTKNSTIIDIGCGNGRDSAFFASLGKSAIGIDGSETIVYENNKVLSPLHSHLEFKLADFNNPIETEITLPENSVVYCRFFVHAINDQAEDNLLSFLQS